MVRPLPRSIHRRHERGRIGPAVITEWGVKMKTLGHYAIAAITIIMACVICLTWVAALNLRSFPIGMVMAPGLTVAVAVFAVGVIQHMRGKIDLYD